MARFSLYVLILLSLLTVTCTSRKNKLDHKDMIPENDLISIITEVYMADGLLALPVVNHWFAYLDSASAYNQTIEKFGYTKETMDKTMKYYFIKNPKKLISIYDKVLAILSEMETYLEQESVIESERVRNTWTGKEYYSYPGNSENDSSDFSISLPNNGIYVLSFTVTLSPVDQSQNPRFFAYSVNADSLDTGKRSYYESINYIKDAQPHNYSISFEVSSSTKLSLTGNFFCNDNHPDGSEVNAIIEDIILIFGLSIR